MGGGYFATHYDRLSYQRVRDYFEKFLGTSMFRISKLDRDDQLVTMRAIVLSFTRAELEHKESIFGGQIDYILSKRKMNTKNFKGESSR